jgi:uroporphyrinogen decarboxylase
MTDAQWTLFRSILSGEANGLNVGLIADSPWIPGYCGISTIDFFARPDEWFAAYMKIKKDFPEVLFLPDWWVEYGMATEPSGFGVKINFYDSNLPTVHHLIDDMDNAGEIIDRIMLPDPRKDGLMPLVLNLQRSAVSKLQDTGERIRIVSSRGPLTIASHLFSVTELLMCVKTDPEPVHKLLKITTQLCKDWLDAQLENVGTAEGILVLDDVSGFFNHDDYMEFAHPYLKEIFSGFPECLHLFHNDTDNDTCFSHLDDMGVDLFNFTHKKSISRARELAGGKVTLLGNIPPMSLARNTPTEVYALAKDCISEYVSSNGGITGLILSVGGGAPMEAKGECIEAMVNAAKGL